MRSVLLSVVLILTSLPAFAAEASSAEPQESVANQIETSILRGIYASTFAVHAYDARMTQDALNAGAREVDPLMRPFAAHPSTLIIANLARAVAIDFGLHSVAQRHKILAIAIGIGINSAYLAIAEHNRHVANMMEAQNRARR